MRMRRSTLRLYGPFLALALVQALFIVASPSKAPDRSALAAGGGRAGSASSGTSPGASGKAGGAASSAAGTPGAAPGAGSTPGAAGAGGGGGGGNEVVSNVGGGQLAAG